MYSEQRQSNNGHTQSSSSNSHNSHSNSNYNKIMGSNGIDVGIGGFDYSH